jgi:hypothetical protein
MHLLRNLPALLFGLLFAGGGFFVLSQTAWPTWQSWTSMQSWQPHQAQLLQVSGADSDTVAQYRYTVDGMTYENDQVYVAKFKDNIGSYHADMQRELHAKKRAVGAVSIWINPRNPQQSVIDRDMRWGIFALMVGFCSIFIFVGGVIAWASITPSKKTASVKRPSLSELRTEWEKKLDNPEFQESFIEFSQSRMTDLNEQPKDSTLQSDWRNRQGWETAHIRSEAKSGLLGIWVFAIFWNAISSPILFVFPKEWARENYVILFGLLFPLVGAFLLYKAIVQTLEYRHFGKILFEMDPYPGAIGGNVGGRVHIVLWRTNRGMSAKVQTKVRLECVHSYVSGSGKDRTRKENIKWAQEGEPRIESAVTGLSLAFRFDVPDGLPEANVDQSGAYHFWRLTVKAERQGIDLNRQYNIPVFQTSERSRYVDHDISAQVAQRKEDESDAIREAIAAGNFDLPGLSRAMRLTNLGGELRLVFPMFRNKILTVFAVIFAGGFGFASYSMLSELSPNGFFGVFIGFFSIPFVLVALIATIATIYLPLNNLRVTIGRNQVTILRRLLFIPIYYRQLVWSDIDHLTLKRSGSTGQGVDKIEHFKVKAKLKRGGTVTLAEDLDGDTAAGHFRDFLAQRLNVQTESQLP